MNATLASSDFRGSIPSKYDAYLGPILFRPFALDMAQRIPSLPPHGKVLEIACGTGQLTRILRSALPVDVQLIATDLSESMLDHAQKLHADVSGVDWRQEDMSDLQCVAGSYDAVFCQFGTMFCEDKQVVFSEAFRALHRGGRFIFNVWDALEFNDLPRTADAVLHFAVPDAPRFFDIPHGFNDHHIIRDMLLKVGFKHIEIETVHKPCIMPSAHNAAIGLIEGTPNIIALHNAGIDDPTPIEASLEHEIAVRYGDHPVRSRMQAIVCTAQKP